MSVTAKKLAQTSLVGKSSIFSYYCSGVGYQAKLNILATIAPTSTQVFEIYHDGTYLQAREGIVSSGIINHTNTTILASNVNITASISAELLSSTAFVIGIVDSVTGYGKAIVCTLSGSTITVGSSYVFSTARVGRVVIKSLSPTSIIIGFAKQMNVSYSLAVSGRMVIATISGSTITYGTEEFFSSACCTPYNNDGYFDIAIIDSTTAAIIHSGSIQGTSPSGSRILYVKISGTTISSDSWKSDYTGTINDRSFASCSLDSTKIVVADINPGIVRVGVVNGTAITYGTAVTIGSMGSYCYITALSSTTFVLAYVSGGQTICRVGTVSGTTITLGSEYAVDSVNGGGICSISISSISATTFIVSWIVTTNFYGKSAIGTVTGTTIAYGAAAVVSPNNYGSFGIFVKALSATSAVVMHMNDNNLYAIALSISGTTITFGTGQLVANAPSGSVYRPGIDVLSSTQALIAFTYYNGSQYVGYTCLLTTSGTSVTVGSTTTLFTGGSPSSVAPPEVAVMSSTRALITYSRPSNGHTIIPISISGTTLTVVTVANAGSWVPFSQGEIYTNQTGRLVLTKLDSNNVCLLYAETISNTYNIFRAAAKVMRLKSDSAVNNVWIGSSGGIYSATAVVMSATKLYCIYGTSNNYRLQCIIDLSSGSFDVNQSGYYAVDAGTIGYGMPSMYKLDSSRVFVAYCISKFVRSGVYAGYTYGVIMTVSGVGAAGAGKVILDSFGESSTQYYNETSIVALGSSYVTSAIPASSGYGVSQAVNISGNLITPALTPTLIATGVTGGHTEISLCAISNMSADTSEVVLLVGGTGSSNVIRLVDITPISDVNIAIGRSPIILEAGVPMYAYTQMQNTGIVVTVFGVEEV